MTNLKQQIAYITRELENHKAAYAINLNKLNNGDRTVINVLPLLDHHINLLASIKISLETLKNL